MSLKKAVLISSVSIAFFVVLLFLNSLTKSQVDNSNFDNNLPRNDEDIFESIINDEVNDNANTDYVESEYVSTSIPDPNIVTLEFVKANLIDSESWSKNHFNGYHTIYSENIIEAIIDVYENNYGDNVVLVSDDVSFKCSKTQFNTEYNDYYVTGLHWNDIYKKFPVPLSLTPQGFSYAKCDNFVIIGGTLTPDYNYDSETKWYLITENELYEMNNIPSEDMVKYRFFETDGKVSYTKTNTDYIIAVQALEYMIDAYTHDGQFYAESGEVVLNNDGPKYVMKEYYTINDLYRSKDTFLGYDRKSMGAETVGEFYSLLLEKSREFDTIYNGTEITEKKSLVFSISQGLKNYSIILDSQYLTDDIQDEKSNYYEFVSLGDFPSINSIELKALYHCTEENIQTQSDYIILNYQSSATIFFCENFSYSNNNTLMTYAIQDNETSKYCFVCLLYDIENNMLCEFILEIGDIETFRVNSSNNTVKQMFENIYITETPYSQKE